MTSTSARSGEAWLRIADLAALSFALPVAARVYERIHGHAPLPSLDTLFQPMLLALGLWLVSAWVHRVYDQRPRAGAMALLRSARARTVVGIVFGVVELLRPAEHGIGILTVLAFTIGFALLAAVRAVFRLVALVLRRRGYHERRFAVVGGGAIARDVVEAMAAHPEWGQRFVGFVSTGGPELRSRGPLLGRLSALDEILRQNVIDEIVFAVPRDALDVVERAVPVCEEYGVEYQITLDVLRFGQSSVHVSGIDGIPTLAFTRTPTDTVALGAKRFFDVVASALALALLSPVFAAIAVAIKLDSRGPVFFRQRRSGLNGRVFDMLKFRSMYVDAEARLEELKKQNEMSGPVFKMANDPRVTRVGRFLRRTSLDEFPQFWNVLKGEMSVVGPRPPIPAEVRQYKRWQRRRLSMKPGITCIWQISGRNNIDFDHWMELDLEYIDHWSLWTDLEICVKTIPAVLSARGAR